MSLVDPSVRRYGKVEIGRGVIIDANVTLGQPAATDLLARAPSAGHYTTVQEFFDSFRPRTTVIGDEAIIRSGTVIYAGTVIESGFDCGHNVIVREDVRIGAGVYLKNNTELMRGVHIGAGCRVSGVVADRAVLGERVSSFGVLTHSYRTYLEPVRTAGTEALDRELGAPTVEDDAIIARGAMVIGAVTIGAGAMVGPNAVVTFDVLPGERVVGPRGFRRAGRHRATRSVRSVAAPSQPGSA
jgi:serine acetyltransferase